MNDSQDKFTKQYAVKISADSQKRNGKEYKTDTDTQADYAVNETGHSFSKSVENTGQHSVQIQKGTDKADCLDINAGGCTVKQKFA